MQITYNHTARVYTWPEVKKIVEETKKATADAILRNRDVMTEALTADHEKAMLILCLRALQMDGFQKIPMERMMTRIADMVEDMAAGKIDYNKDIVEPVEGCLGYKIEADGLMEELEARVK